MQGFITTPLAQAIATAEGVDYLTSSSVQGTSTITAYIQLDFDPDKALTEVMAKVQQVKYLIPTGAQDPIIVKATGQTTAVMYIGFSSDELSSAAISDYLTRVVQPLLDTVPGVASADILGGQTFAMRLWLDPARMAARGISADDVVGGDPGQQLPIGARPGEGLFHGHQRQRQYRADRCRAIQGHGRQGEERRVGADGGHRHRRSRRAELDLERHDERAARRVHRHPGDARGQPADPGQGRARAACRRSSATCRLRSRCRSPTNSTKFIQASIDEVKASLGSAVAHRRRRDLPVPRQPARRW